MTFTFVGRELGECLGARSVETTKLILLLISEGGI